MIVVLSDKCLGPSNRFLRHSVFLEIFQFGQNSDLGFDRLAGLEIDFEIAEVAKRVQRGRAAGDDALLIPHVLVEDGGSTFTQDCCQNFQSARIVGENAGAVEAQCDVILLDWAAFPGVAQAVLLGFNRTVVALERLIFRGTVELDHLIECRFDVHLTCNGQDDVGRTIKFLEVGDDIIAR